MADKRTFPRKKKRLLVDFDIDGISCAGFTIDLSYTGLFIGSGHMPKMGQTLTVNLHFPGDKRMACTGRVVRGRKMPTALAQTDVNGFCLEITTYNEAYTRYFAGL